MTSPKIEVVEKAVQTTLGEAPHWCPEEQVLYYVDIIKGRVYRYDPRKRKCDFVDVSGGLPIGFVIPIKGQEGRFLIGRGPDLCKLIWNSQRNKGPYVDPNSHGLKTLANVDKSTNRFNDGKCDPLGRLWAGTMPFFEKPEPPKNMAQHQGKLYLLKQNPKEEQKVDFEIKVEGVDISNGLEWSLDGKKMYYIDSLTLKIDSFDFDIETGNISNRRTVFDLKENEIKGFPDGMTICDKGHLWVACFGGSQVIVIDPETGNHQSISFEGLALNITSVMFGGENLEDLYVTSATHEENGEIKGGKLFVVKNTGAKGIPARNFDSTAF